jgi:hypothetical protein
MQRSRLHELLLRRLLRRLHKRLHKRLHNAPNASRC